MTQYKTDSHKERAIGRYLDQHLYDQVADWFERDSTEAEQKAGIDLQAVFPWHDGPVAIDEKAQTDYVNDVAETFVLEIFGETYREGDSIRPSTGWFIDDETKTDFYLFVWPTRASVFTLEAVTAESDPVLVYEPADPEQFATEWERRESLRNLLNQKMEAEYRVWYTDENLSEFSAVVEEVPAPIRYKEANKGRRYLDPENIQELKAVLLEKEGLRERFEEWGLAPDTLRETGLRAAETRTDQWVDTPMGELKIKCSNRDGENPVNVIVPYRIYHALAEETYLIRPAEFKKGVRLFK